MNKRKHLLFILLLAFCCIAFYAVKFYGPHWVETLYKNQSFSTLNTIVHVKENKNLDYYLGDVEIALLGPLKSVIAGLAFLCFCLVYLRGASTFWFGVAVFAYFLATRFEVLFNPPLGEAITGPFSDALWLVQNKLNYIGLLHQDTVATGGPQIYPTSLYTLFLATLMYAIPSVTAFLVVMHILVFAMASTVVALLRKISLKVFNPSVAMLLALFLLAIPLFQSMAELINLEMPSLFFAMVCVYYLTQQRMLAASIAALSSIFTKDPGIIACAAVFLFGLKIFITEPKRQGRFKFLAWGMIVVVITAVKSVVRSIIMGEQKVYNMVCPGCGWHNISYSIWFWIYIITLVILIVSFLRHRKSIDTETGLMFLMTGLWFMLFTNFLTLTYRYQLLFLPFLIFCIGFYFFTIIRNEKVFRGILVFLIMFSFVCSHGLMYGNKRFTDCFPTHLERSLEYRNYLKLEQILAKKVESRFSGWAIVAPFQTAQLLFLPKLGYVTKPLDVTVYSMRATLGLKPYTGYADLNILRTIWIGFPHHGFHGIKFPYPIDPNDRIVDKIRVGHIEAVLFMGGTAIEKMRLTVLYMLQKGYIKPNPIK
ncbi:MAG TPA: hypothetical protein PL155_08930 [Candidatus Omnitrophota bacterium]|nr:hypothetical protein [Candidatus Omnitrophota bacterium]HPD85420.1 hypothetical protein [Candidatus Omnitrophota bacterium]HRZ04079.1 hypothetical protein [Candidatus Omnitrophota bacterium]